MNDDAAKSTLREVTSVVGMVTLALVSMVFFAWLSSFLYGFSVGSLVLGALFGFFVFAVGLYFYLNHEIFLKVKRKGQNP